MLDLAGHRLAHLESGEDIRVLVAVLARAQRHRLLDDGVFLFLGEGLFDLGHLLLLRLLQLGVVVLVGYAHHRDPVGVVEESALDELLPVLGVGVDRSLEFGGQHRDLEGLHAVAAVHPRPHRPESHSQAKVGAHLRGAELNLVHDRVDALLGEALLRDPLQRALYLGLHLGHVRLGHALQAHRERRFPPGRRVSRPRGESRAQPRLEQGLVEVRLRSVEQEVGRDGEGEVLELRLLLLDLVDHEVGHRDGALLVRVRNDGIRRDGYLHLHRRRQPPLVRDVQRADVDAVELTERELLGLGEGPLQREVPVGEHPRVAGVVVRGVEPGKVLVG
mmetsp:Transcript_14411/g.58757  ORF Transcript_14411/g.58757 Transcript_14411/m.58757 type:complete len:333 (-) Transcript_14411:897-1895(-)